MPSEVLVTCIVDAHRMYLGFPEAKLLLSMVKLSDSSILQYCSSFSILYWLFWVFFFIYILESVCLAHKITFWGFNHDIFESVNIVGQN